MKIVKVNEKEGKVTRKLIAKFGETVYNYPDVKSIFIKVNFKDGSSIGFKRDEEEDEIEELFSREMSKDREE